jgi:hypothetical protein
VDEHVLAYSLHAFNTQKHQLCRIRKQTIEIHRIVKCVQVLSFDGCRWDWRFSRVCPNSRTPIRTDVFVCFVMFHKSLVLAPVGYNVN